MGEELLLKEVSLELAQRGSMELGDAIAKLLLADPDSADPLNSLISQSLLSQAVERLGLLPSQQEATDYTKQMEDVFLHSRSAPETKTSNFDGALELLRLHGFPAEDWAASEELVERYRETLGLVALRQQECSPSPTPPPGSFVSFGLDCADFLAEERANAVIEYFVVWAE